MGNVGATRADLCRCAERLSDRRLRGLAFPSLHGETHASDRCLPGVLVVISAVGSWEFACITPFAAFAVVAAYALSMRAALFTVAGVWLANQAIGFAVLGYPWAVDTILWGIAIGAAAVLAAGLACATLRLGIPNKVIAVGDIFRRGARCIRRRLVSGDLRAWRPRRVHARPSSAMSRC